MRRADIVVATRKALSHFGEVAILGRSCLHSTLVESQFYSHTLLTVLSITRIFNSFSKHHNVFILNSFGCWQGRRLVTSAGSAAHSNTYTAGIRYLSKCPCTICRCVRAIMCCRCVRRYSTSVDVGYLRSHSTFSGRADC